MSSSARRNGSPCEPKPNTRSAPTTAFAALRARSNRRASFRSSSPAWADSACSISSSRSSVTSTTSDRQSQLAPEPPQPDRLGSAGLGNRCERGAADLFVERMAVVRARRDDQSGAELLEHRDRLGLVDPQLERGAAACLLELAPTTGPLRRPAERAGDVDDAPACVTQREERGGRAEQLVVGVRREVDGDAFAHHPFCPHSAAPIAPARGPSSASAMSICSSGATRARAAIEARSGPSSSSPASSRRRRSRPVRARGRSARSRSRARRAHPRARAHASPRRLPPARAQPRRRTNRRAAAVAIARAPA